MYSVLRHQEEDSVGVMLHHVEVGKEVSVKDISNPKDVKVIVRQEIPTFHKIALKELKKGEPVTEYGQVIGVATEDIAVGEYVHIHNLKTRKW